VNGDELTHAYVGTRPCGHVGFIGVDDASKFLANEIAKLIRRRWTIERTTIEAARQADIRFCDCEKKTPRAPLVKTKAKR
jgi:hypothetical protein